MQRRVIPASRKGKLVLAGVLVLALSLVMGTAAPGMVSAAPELSRYMVGFRDLPDTAAVREAGGEVIHSYGIIPAVAAYLPEAAVKALEKNSNVAYVEPDHVAFAAQQILPWGVERIGAHIVHEGGNFGTGIRVGIVDTGIAPDHPDLDVAGGVTFVSGTSSWADDNGHGTHVAGVAAALDNDIGVIGVAPGVALYAIKVLNANGSGYYSDIVAGIDWAVENDMQVINMSLGGSSGSTALEQACDNAYAAGLVLVASAGGSGNPEGTGDNVVYPARYDSVIAVGATDANDERAPFSSTGPSLELCAPGVDILSTTPGGGYVTLTGTSFASPHVAGVAALVFSANPTFTNQDVRDAMNSTAIDLGEPGHDPQYGYGLVYAPRAVGGGTQPPPLVVTVATDKRVYSGWLCRVVVTTTVMDTAGLPVEYASVEASIIDPHGSIFTTSSGTTTNSGQYVFSFSLSIFDPRGTYTATSTASKVGYTPGAGSTTFDYKP